MYSIQRSIPGDPSWIPAFKLSSRLETRKKNRSGNRRRIPVETVERGKARRYVHIRMILLCDKILSCNNESLVCSEPTAERCRWIFSEADYGIRGERMRGSRGRSQPTPRVRLFKDVQGRPRGTRTSAYRNAHNELIPPHGHTLHNSLWKSHCLSLLRLFRFLLASSFSFIVYFVIVVGTTTMWKRRLQMRHPGIWRNVK